MTHPTNQVQLPPSEALAPPKLLFAIQNGRYIRIQDEEKKRHLLELMKNLGIPENAPVKHFMVSQGSDGEVIDIESENGSHRIPVGKLSAPDAVKKPFIDAIRYITGSSNQPPVYPATQQHQQQQVMSSPDSQAPQQQHLAPASATQNPQQQDPAIAPPRQREIDSLLDRLDRIEEQLRRPLPQPQQFQQGDHQAAFMPAPQVPIRHQSQLYQLLRAYLREKKPDLQRIERQLIVNSIDKCNLTLQLARISQEGVQALAPQDLEHSQAVIQEIVLRHLQTMIQDLQEPQYAHLLAVLTALNLPNEQQRAFLQNLLNPPIGAPQPQELDNLLAVNQAIETVLNMYLQAEMTQIETSLNQSLQINPLPPKLTNLKTELLAIEKPTLLRLIQMDNEITTSLKEAMEEKISALRDVTQHLQADHVNAFTYPIQENQSRAQLLAIPTLIAQNFHRYVRDIVQIIPQEIQLDDPANAQLNSNITTANAILPQFTQYLNQRLDSMPRAKKNEITQLSQTTLGDCLIKYQTMQNILTKELKENLRSNPTSSSQELLNELQGGNVSFERLIEIKKTLANQRPLAVRYLFNLSTYLFRSTQ